MNSDLCKAMGTELLRTIISRPKKFGEKTLVERIVQGYRSFKAYQICFIKSRSRKEKTGKKIQGRGKKNLSLQREG